MVWLPVQQAKSPISLFPSRSRGSTGPQPSQKPLEPMSLRLLTIRMLCMGRVTELLLIQLLTQWVIMVLLDMDLLGTMVLLLWLMQSMQRLSLPIQLPRMDLPRSTLTKSPPTRTTMLLPTTTLPPTSKLLNQATAQATLRAPTRLPYLMAAPNMLTTTLIPLVATWPR